VIPVSQLQAAGHGETEVATKSRDFSKVRIRPLRHQVIEFPGFSGLRWVAPANPRKVGRVGLERARRDSTSAEIRRLLANRLSSRSSEYLMVGGAMRCISPFRITSASNHHGRARSASPIQSRHSKQRGAVGLSTRRVLLRNARRCGATRSSAGLCCVNSDRRTLPSEWISRPAPQARNR